MARLPYGDCSWQIRMRSGVIYEFAQTLHYSWTRKELAENVDFAA
jgi:hypothetical protein